MRIRVKRVISRRFLEEECVDMTHDARRMILEVTPGKKGGEFRLPFGGRLVAPPGVFQRKHVVTCCVVSPSNRHKYLPPSSPEEQLASEVFLFSTNMKRNQPPITLTLPYVPVVHPEVSEVVLYHRKVDGEEWTTLEIQSSEPGTFLTVEALTSGLYVAVRQPRCETFPFPVAGTLHSAKLHRQISVRVPKRATDVDQTCDIKILSLSTELLEHVKRQHPYLVGDMLLCSDVYHVQTSLTQDFRRAITVKLPLPTALLPPQAGGGGVPLAAEDLVVLRAEPGGEWSPLLEGGAYRLSKNSISFDTKRLTRFCIVLAKPDRKKRMKEVMRLIEKNRLLRRIEVLPFIHLQDKLWILWVEAVRMADVEDTVNKRLEQGFRRITLREVVPEPEDPNRIIIRRNWRSKRVPREPEEKLDQNRDLDLNNGSQFDLELSGDLAVTFDDPSQGFMGLHFHDLLKENYRKFQVQPASQDLVEKHHSARASLKMFSSDETTGSRVCVRVFDIEVKPQAVADFFYVEPDPEPVVEESPMEEEGSPGEAPPAAAAAVTSSSPTRRPLQESHRTTWLRLTRPVRPPRRVTKEARVLSGRSLLSLAREVEQGLTLAIHLHLTDSTITGMGFDALARGQSLADITYKVLLLWKRKTGRYKDLQVEMLVRGLEEMGRPDVADVVRTRHAANLELTADCFNTPL